MDILIKIVSGIWGIIFAIFAMLLLSNLSDLPRAIRDFLEPNEGFFKYGKVKLFLTSEDYDFLIKENGLSDFAESKKDTVFNRRKLRKKLTSILQGMSLTSPDWVANRYKFHYQGESAQLVLTEFLDRFSKYKKHVSAIDPIRHHIGPWGREYPYGLVYDFQFKTTMLEIDLTSLSEFFGTTNDWFIVFSGGTYYHFTSGCIYVHLKEGETCWNAE